MASPFPANAVLTFAIATGITTDSRSGNKIPITEEISFKAYLKSDYAPRGVYRGSETAGGLDEAEEPLRGYVVEAPDGSSNLPAGIRHLAKGAAILTDPVTGEQRSGIFTLFRQTPSPFGVEASTGAKISGIFRFTG